MNVFYASVSLLLLWTLTAQGNHTEPVLDCYECYWNQGDDPDCAELPASNSVNIVECPEDQCYQVVVTQYGSLYQVRRGCDTELQYKNDSVPPHPGEINDIMICNAFDLCNSKRIKVNETSKEGERKCYSCMYPSPSDENPEMTKQCLDPGEDIQDMFKTTCWAGMYCFIYNYTSVDLQGNVTTNIISRGCTPHFPGVGTHCQRDSSGGGYTIEMCSTFCEEDYCNKGDIVKPPYTTPKPSDRPICAASSIQIHYMGIIAIFLGIASWWYES